MSTTAFDPTALRTAYVRHVRAADSGLVPLAGRLWQRLNPSRWTLELSLPIWLGDHYGLKRDLSTTITISNVLGLVSLRLADDLEDGDVSASHRADAQRLQAVLYEAALDAYRGFFPEGSDFWEWLRFWMDQWRKVTIGQRVRVVIDPVRERRDLARRGAPLKICAYAICQLASYPGDFEPLALALDDALAAMVLYDHFCDWQDDLAAARWNAFVDHCCSKPQPTADSRPVRARVLVAMLNSDCIATYFDQIHELFADAHRSANDLGIEALSSHIARLSADVDLQSRAAQSRYRAIVDQAAALLSAPQ